MAPLVSKRRRPVSLLNSQSIPPRLTKYSVSSKKDKMSSADKANRGGADRILEAAVLLFGQQGLRGTTMKDIATEAGVSQALIVHHFGTKDALRKTCDDYVARLIRVRKKETIDSGPRFDPFTALRQLGGSRALLQYLTRTLTEGGTNASELIDEIVADAEVYLTQGEQAGLIKHSAVPRDRAVLLTLWSLGALVLHEHVHRLLDVDFLAYDGSPQSLQRYLYPAMELYSQGLVEEGTLDDLVASIGLNATQPDTDHYDKEQ